MRDPRDIFARSPLLLGRPVLDRDALAGDGKVRPLDVKALGGGPLPEHYGAGQVVPMGTFLRRYMPEEFPIPGATEFARDTFLTSPGAGTIIPAALTFRVPAGSIGIIRGFGVGLNNMTTATDVVFSLRVDDRPVPAWGTFRMFPGAASRVTTQVGTWVTLPPLANVSVAITNVDGAVYILGANFSGWYWGVAADQAWKGER